MKSTGITQVAPLLAALFLALPACVTEPDDDSTGDGPMASAAAGLEERGPEGKGGRHGKKRELLRQRFDEADADKDGQVTKQELAKAMEARFKKADGNGDGQLDEAELGALQAEHMARKLQRLDADGDGAVSRDEASFKLQKHFDEIDTDKSGTISTAELTSFKQSSRRGKRGKGKIRWLDADGDGLVSAAELGAHEEKWFSRADVDGDGTVTLKELENAPPRGKKHGQRGRRGYQGMRGKSMMLQHLQAADADGDGQITKAELQTFHTARFEEADKNSDGVLDEAERAAMQQAHGRKGISRLLERADANGDGQLSAGEAPPFLADRFADIDSDGDGQLTAAELKAARPRHGKMGPGGPGFMKGDITKADFVSRADRLLDRLDENGDDVISETELSAAHAAMRGKGTRGFGKRSR